MSDPVTESTAISQWVGILANVPLWALLIIFVKIYITRVATSIKALIESVEKVGKEIQGLRETNISNQKDIEFIKAKGDEVKSVLAFAKEYDFRIEQNRKDLNDALKLVRFRQHWFANKMTIIKGKMELSGVNMGSSDWKIPTKEDM